MPRAFLFLTALFLASCNRTAAPPTPLSHAPADGVKSIQLDPAWKIELYASEPMIADPVAMEIDENGRVYVVQNSGYPLDTEHRLGKIWLLEDSNGDGKPDKSTLFADQLTLPTGVMRWKKGSWGRAVVRSDVVARGLRWKSWLSAAFASQRLHVLEHVAHANSGLDVGLCPLAAFGGNAPGAAPTGQSMRIHARGA